MIWMTSKQSLIILKDGKPLLTRFDDKPTDILSLLKDYLKGWKKQEDTKERSERPAEDDTIRVKRLKMFHDEKLTRNLRALAQTEEREGFFEVTNGFPYPSDLDLRALLLRQCYLEVFDLLVQSVSKKKKLAISGTPGIGKSLFFIYMLW
jgi:hypothetical protein